MMKYVIFQKKNTKICQEALEDEVWKKVMDKELQIIEKKWDMGISSPPLSAKPIGLKWVFKVKKDSVGKNLRHKVRLVIKWYV